MWEAWLCQLEVISRGIKRSWFEKEICESPDHKATQQDIFDKRCRDGKIVVIVMVTLCCLPMSPCWWSPRRNHSRPVFVTTSSSPSCSTNMQITASNCSTNYFHSSLSPICHDLGTNPSTSSSGHFGVCLGFQWHKFSYHFSFSKGLNLGTNSSIVPSTRHLLSSAIFDRLIFSF